ncbi:hypothetical protein DFR33_107222 [Bradymonas sediminis]|uniref:Uncharacterized protein n=2 Tax=Bradymonas sediminis TaxID=1548548 RepID=A0A2Z4FNU7_9DELT|nr:hypothetical protein DN745_13985 [Bradymonas sediminis]TDP72238.1 hypothetical protein DFR33_107222 [Bradymonas sediminis]
MTIDFNKLLISGLKLGASGALICAIAWAVVTFSSPGGEVEPAEATILSMDMFAPASKSKRFADTLEAFDMEEPRAYDWNGNTVYFSMATTDASPMEVLHAFQQELVQNGVNKKMHTRILPSFPRVDSFEALGKKSESKKVERWSESKRAQLDDFFAGGLVPITIRPGYVAMAGATSKGEADNAVDFFKEQIAAKRSLEDSVKIMRYVEARRAPDEAKTMISAVWSDDKLEMDKFAPDSKRSDLAVSSEAPACLGCRRIMSFGGTGKEANYGTNVFVGYQHVDETIQFYDRAMQNRGWKPATASIILRRLAEQGVIPPSAARTVSFNKDGKFATVVAYPSGMGGETQVHVFESP